MVVLYFSLPLLMNSSVEVCSWYSGFFLLCFVARRSHTGAGTRAQVIEVFVNRKYMFRVFIHIKSFCVESFRL